MNELRCKLLVIGGGPGGYVAAIRAGQNGVDTILVEKQALGGTCLNVGCIPSKAMIHAAETFHAIAEAASGASRLGISTSSPSVDLKATVAWKDGIVGRLTGGVAALLKKAGVRVVIGHAGFIDGKTVEVETAAGASRISAETVVIATGSSPVELPALPFGGSVLSSTEALALTEIPEALVIVGGGYIGLEIGTAMRKLGAAVTIVEAAERPLPLYDADLTRPVVQRLKALGIDILTGARARQLLEDGRGVLVETSDGATKTLVADKILVTVGRKPATTGFGLEGLGLAMAGPFIRIDATCRTSMRGVYAIGDVTGEPMLAHRAMAQGEMVADIVAGKKRGWDKYAIPAICFTDPEIVTVGQSPEQAKADGLDVVTGTFPFRANGRAMTLERDDGFVRVVARADNHLILGIQATGAGIAELAAGFALALEMGSRLEDIAATIHAHPTQGEAFQEAALMALGQAIHF
jgi:dihydrolipoamide dehydrogenase